MERRGATPKTFSVRFPNLADERSDAIFGLANLLADQDQSSRPHNAETLLRTVFNHPFIRESGIDLLQGTAQEVIGRLNPDGIAAAGTDNTLLRNEAYIGGLKVWNGKEEPWTDAASDVGDYKCGRGVRVKVDLSLWVELRCKEAHKGVKLSDA